MANPIKSSDLFIDDGAIKKAIEDLEKLQDTYKKVLGEVSKQAIQMSAKVKTLNTTTAGQRSELEKTAKQTDQLAKAYEKYNQSLEDSAIELEELKLQQRQLNTFNRATAKLNKSLEGSYNRLSAQYTLNKLKLNQMSAAVRKNTKEGQNLEKQTAAIFEEMKALQEATGKHVLSVGDYEKALRGISGPLGGFVDSIKGARNTLISMRATLQANIKSLGIFKTALISTGIGAIVVALGSLVALLTKTQRGLDFVSRISASVGAAFSVVIDRAAKLGEAIIAVFNLDFQQAAQLAKDAFTGIGEEIAKETIEAGRLTGVLQQLREERRALSVETEKQRAVIKRLNQEGEDTTLSDQKRLQSLQKAFDIENNLLKQREDLLKRELATIKSLNEQGESLAEDLDRQADKEIELAKVQQESFELQTTLQNKINTIRRETSADIQKQAEQERALREEQSARIQEIIKLNEDADAQLKGQAAQAKLTYDRALDSLEELRKEAEKLGLTLDFDNMEALALKNFKETLESIRPEIVEALPSIKQTSALSNELAQAIANINTAASESTSGDSESFLESIGVFITPDQMNGVKTAFNEFKSLFQELTAERVAAANAMVEQTTRIVDSEKLALDAELQRNRDGLASNIERAQAEFDLARSNQRRALSEQRRAQRQQALIQTAQQAGNLITASSKIWAQLGFPFALPAIGVLFGSFIASKLRARNLARDTRGTGSFEFLNYGGTHQSQNDIDLGLTRDGKQRVVEKNESLGIFSRAATTKYRGILPGLVNSINALSLESLLSGRSGGAALNIHAHSTDMSNVERELSAIRKQGEEKRFGNIVQRGNLTTRYI